MRRRKYLAALGSVAAGGAAALGTGAFSIVSAGRDMSVSVVGDQQAYLKFDPSISPYASIDANGQMVLQFDGSNGQNGQGLNDEANSLFQNVFRIENQGTNTINVVLTALDTSTTDGDGVDPVTIYWTDDEVDVNSPGYAEMSVMNGSPNPLGDESWGTSTSLPVLAPGDDIYVHIEFYLSSSSTLSDVKTWPGAIPDEINFYAQGYNN